MLAARLRGRGAYHGPGPAPTRAHWQSTPLSTSTLRPQAIGLPNDVGVSPDHLRQDGLMINPTPELPRLARTPKPAREPKSAGLPMSASELKASTAPPTVMAAPVDPARLMQAVLGPGIHARQAGTKSPLSDFLLHSNASTTARLVGTLANLGQFNEALTLLRELVKQDRHDVLTLVSHRYFMQQAKVHKEPAHATAFLRSLPVQHHTVHAYTLALSVCSAAQDLQSARTVMEIAASNGMPHDTHLMTALIDVCRAVGAADRALMVYQDMKRRGLTIDAHVFGALLASYAEAVANTTSDNRREKYLLLEQASAVMAQADELGGVRLNIECWNALIACAARSGQIERALEWHGMLQGRGLQADAMTYGTLVEACVQAGEFEKALQWYRKALSEGYTQHVELHTAALTACRTPDGGQEAVEQVQFIHSSLLQSGVQPDGQYLNAYVMALCQCGELDTAFQALQLACVGDKVVAQVVCSGLLLACLIRRRFEIARQVYDLCAKQGVYPGHRHYNILMQWYGSQRRLGDVVSLLEDMTQHAQLQPDIHTYQVVLNACQRADQTGLAFEVYTVMKATRMQIVEERCAHAICFTLLKACFNMQRHLWAVHTPQPRSGQLPWNIPWAAGYLHNQLPEVRMLEAQHVLAALGSTARIGGQSLLNQQGTVATWGQQALEVYRDLLVRGWRPSLQILDMLLACLRLPAYTLTQRAGAAAAELQPSAMSTERSSWLMLQPGSQPLRHSEQLAPKYEMVFDRRALALVEDAIARGLMPPIAVDRPLMLDLRGMPPTAAEVYTLAILMALERRAARGGREGLGQGLASEERTVAADGQLFFHRIVLRVPPFDKDLNLWPSYVPKLHKHTDQEESEEEQSDQDSPQPTEQQHNSSEGLEGSGSDQNGVPQDHSNQGEGEGSDPESLPGHGSTQTPEPAPQVPPPSDANQGGGTATDHQLAAIGLAVAATCRRMKIWAFMDAANGCIILEPNEIQTWVRSKRTWEMRLSGMLEVAGAPQGALAVASQHPGSKPQLPLAPTSFSQGPQQLGLSLAQQQSRIRNASYDDI